MPKFSRLIRGVIGLNRRPKTLNGVPVPESLRGYKAVATASDRFLHVGIFACRRKKTCVYRIVAWRTYRDRKTGKLRATTTLYRDQIDPLVRLVAQCGERLPPQ